MENLLVRKLAARDRLSDAESQALEKAPVRRALIGARQDLVHGPSKPTESCLLLDGFAASYNVLQEGQRQITAIHVAGDFVDLHSLLLDPIDHSIVGLTDCRCAFVPHAYLREVTDMHPHLSRLLWLDTLIDSAVHRQWLVAMGRRSSEDHLAHLFCELYLRLQTVGLASDYRFRLPITQADVGDAMGISVVHVNRVLRDPRERDLVTWQHGLVTVLDWEGLRRTAEFDPSYLNLVSRPR